jgi:hypothetical protein
MVDTANVEVSKDYLAFLLWLEKREMTDLSNGKKLEFFAAFKAGRVSMRQRAIDTVEEFIQVSPLGRALEVIKQV